MGILSLAERLVREAPRFSHFVACCVGIDSDIPAAIDGTGCFGNIKEITKPFRRGKVSVADSSVRTRMRIRIRIRGRVVRESMT